MRTQVIYTTATIEGCWWEANKYYEVYADVKDWPQHINLPKGESDTRNADTNITHYRVVTIDDPKVFKCILKTLSTLILDVYETQVLKDLLSEHTDSFLSEVLDEPKMLVHKAAIEYINKNRDLIASVKTKNPVSNPSHYTSGKIEVIDFIEDQKLNFRTGNAVKYISRAGKKDPAKYVEDLQKAIWYIEREINHYNNGNGI